MTLDLIQFLIFGTLLLLAAWPLGHYMARVFTGEVQFLASVEHALLRLAGQTTPQPQRWQVYALSLLVLFLCLAALAALLVHNFQTSKLNLLIAAVTVATCFACEYAYKRFKSDRGS